MDIYFKYVVIFPASTCLPVSWSGDFNLICSYEITQYSIQTTLQQRKYSNGLMTMGPTGHVIHNTFQKATSLQPAEVQA